MTKKLNKKQPEKIRTSSYVAPALAFIFIVSLIIRMLPYDKVFVNGDVLFYGYDTYFFLWKIIYSVSHFPGILQFDYYQDYPWGGGGTNPFYILFASFIALIAGLGSPSPHTVEVSTALLPPVIGALTIFPVYFIAKEIFDSKVGLVSALMLGVSNYNLASTVVGRSDHDFMDIFFISLIVLFFILAKRKADGVLFGNMTGAVNLKQSLIYSLLAGFTIAAFAFEWRGGYVLNYIILLYAFVQFSIDRYRNTSSNSLFFAGSVMFGTAATAVSIVYLVLTPPWLNFFWVIEILLVFIAFFLPGLLSMFLERRGARWYLFPGITLIASIVSLVAVFTYSSSLSTYLNAGIEMIVGRKSLGVTETQSLFDLRIENSLLNDKIFLLLITLGFMYYILSLRKKGSKNADVFFAIWTFVFIILTATQIRFARLLDINLAILAGFLFFQFFEFFRFKKVNARILNNVLVIALLFIFVAPQMDANMYFILHGEPEIVATGLYDPLVWMRESTPAASFNDTPSLKPDYGIMSFRDHGYWITYVARRPNFVSPGQGNVAQAMTFYTLTDEGQANGILDRNKLRYVIAYQENGVSDLFLSESRFAGDPDLFNNFEIPRLEGKINESFLNKRFYDTMYARMSLFDGTLDESPLLDDVEPLKHHRLVYESPPQSDNIIKIFEYVNGTVIEGTTGRSIEVKATTIVRTNRGRKFNYTGRSVSDSNGNFTITVPYSRDAPYETKAAGSYNILAGDIVLKTVDVKESDIMNGTVINIGYLNTSFLPVIKQPSSLELAAGWSYETKSEINSFVSVKGDTVYTASNDGIYAFDAAGKLKWEYRTDSEPFPVLGNNLYAATRNGSLYALDSNGSLIWKTGLDGKAYAAPLFYEGLLYAGSDSGLHVINSETGRGIWDYRVDGAIIATPVVSNNILYILSLSSNVFVLQAFDLQNRIQLWARSGKTGIWSFPAAVNNTVIFGTRDNGVYALDASTGRILWNYRTGGMVDSAPYVVGGVVYIGSYDGKVHAINLSSGERIWKSQTMAPIYAQPVVLDNMVVVGALDKTLYVLDRGTGTIIGKYASNGSITAPAAVMKRTIYVGAKDGLCQYLISMEIISS